MQQVFGLMNTLLRNDPNTTKRRLQIRQYKVVPLSQRSGVLVICYSFRLQFNDNWLMDHLFQIVLNLK